MSFKDHVSHGGSVCPRSGLKQLRRCLLPHHRSADAVLLNTGSGMGGHADRCHESNQFATETLTS